jgi:hypothetical protein
VRGDGVSLTLSYFHAGCRNIIGAKSFHGPVRDGKGWGQLAMGVKLKGVFVRRRGFKSLWERM